MIGFALGAMLVTECETCCTTRAINTRLLAYDNHTIWNALWFFLPDLLLILLRIRLAAPPVATHF